MHEKLSMWLVGITVMVGGGFVISYVPALRDSMPAFISAPDSTVTFSMADLTVSELADGDAAVNKHEYKIIRGGCEKIPFLLRPIAGPPSATKVIYTDVAGERLGWATYSCKSGRVIQHSKIG